jgi:hypothetical protein
LFAGFEVAVVLWFRNGKLAIVGLELLVKLCENFSWMFAERC